MKEDILKTRIAPTPSGYLHMGNIWSFVLTWLIVKQNKGNIRLRIDDMDTPRFREAYLEDIFASLKWMGLTFDEGPKDCGEFHTSFSQKIRLDQYQEALLHLCSLQVNGQPLVYACSCSREKIRLAAIASGNPKVYPGTCRDKGHDILNPSHILRVNVQGIAIFKIKDKLLGEIDFNPQQDMGDFVIRQKDGSPAYQLTSLIDDQLYATDFIVRGRDLLLSTGAQLLLAQQLKIDSFLNCEFVHHGLLTDAKGHKLSKSEDAKSLNNIRRTKPTPEFLIRYLAKFVGVNEVKTLADLLLQFDFKKIPSEDHILEFNA